MSAATTPQPIYLASYLSPLAPILARADVTDIHVNRPGEIWAETLGGKTEMHVVSGLDEPTLGRLSRQIAALSHQGISREHPLLSAALPDGSRVQIVAPPATRGGVAMSIRKHVASDLKLDDYAAGGAFAGTAATPHSAKESRRGEIAALLENSDFVGALRLAVRGRFNMLVSGGTSTGKTTFLNALIAEIPADERLILIEDTPEIVLSRANAIGLLAARSALGEAAVSADDLVAASLRMRPDRILIGELRGSEALAFLRAINTGHPGSISTVHADSPASAIEQITLLVLQSGTKLSRSDVRDYIRGTIDLFVQLERVGGRRTIRQVTMTPE